MTTTEDQADALAKRTINNLCNAVNRFVQPRIQNQFVKNPLNGLKLPFEPLAAEIRKLMAGETTAPTEPVAPPPPMTDWVESAAPAETKADNPVPLSQRIRDAISAKSMRVSDLVKELNVEKEAVEAAITGDSGLIIAPAGWVKVVQ